MVPFRIIKKGFREIGMKAKFQLQFVGFALALLILTGCSGLYPDRYLAYKRESMIGEGKPPAYVAGYMDGCSSGMRMAGDNKFKYLKDAARAEREALYAKGWDDGQIRCRNEALMEKQREQELNAANCGTGYSNIDQERNRRVAAESKAAEAEMREIWEELKK
jgi:hypothetical protein